MGASNTKSAIDLDEARAHARAKTPSVEFYRAKTPAPPSVQADRDVVGDVAQPPAKPPAGQSFLSLAFDGSGDEDDDSGVGDTSPAALPARRRSYTPVNTPPQQLTVEVLRKQKIALDKAELMRNQLRENPPAELAMMPSAKKRQQAGPPATKRDFLADVEHKSVATPAQPRSPPAKAAVKAVAEDEGEDAGETSTSADTVAEEAGETSTSADTVVEEAGATAAAEAGAAAAASDAEIAQHEHDAGADDAAGETSASVEGQVAAAAAEGGDADMPDYFHADLSKKAADELVSSDDNAKNLFLVRNSKDQGEWFLSVTYKGKPTHHKLKRESEGVLSLNSMVTTFSTIQELVGHLAQKRKDLKWPIPLLPANAVVKAGKKQAAGGKGAGAKKKPSNTGDKVNQNKNSKNNSNETGKKTPGDVAGKKKTGNTSGGKKRAAEGKNAQSPAGKSKAPSKGGE